MSIDDVKVSLYKLGQLMYGYNYEVHFGIELFNNCKEYEDFSNRLKSIFPTSQPASVKLVPLDLQSFWEAINYGLQYRGDDVSGLKLTDKKQERVSSEQKIYIDFLQEFISETAQIFAYPDETGIPGYPVYWDYRFVLFNKKDQCL